MLLFRRESTRTCKVLLALILIIRNVLAVAQKVGKRKSTRQLFDVDSRWQQKRRGIWLGHRYRGFVLAQEFVLVLLLLVHEALHSARERNTQNLTTQIAVVRNPKATR